MEGGKRGAEESTEREREREREREWEKERDIRECARAAFSASCMRIEEPVAAAEAVARTAVA